MGYLVLARKWRPQTFDDMTGQEHVVRTVANAIKLDRVAHAYLFCGPRGVGKTTAARLLAKALNCVNGPTATPCGVCQPCLEIAAGTSVDVAEIDGASNNGVENVREIRENAKYLPQRDRHRIYIIDEVHMLSGAAFNALLKTLEEPPGHVKFIFATTEPHKLPDTILSRCQRHDFRRIPVERMLARLKQIATEEKAGLSEVSLALIVRQADGGMRDALSLLDQVMSACGPEATDAEVAEALGAIDRTVVQTLTTALIRRDARQLLESVEEVFIRGADLKRLAEEVALELRHVLVTRATGRAPPELAESEQRVVSELAQQADPAQLARLFDVLHGAVWDVGRAAQPRLALEMALLKAVQLAPTASIPELLGRVEQLLGPAPAKGGGPVAPPTRGAPVVAPAARSARTVAEVDAPGAPRGSRTAPSEPALPLRTPNSGPGPTRGGASAAPGTEVSGSARSTGPSAQLDPSRPATPRGEQTSPAPGGQLATARPTTPGSEETISAPARTSAQTTQRPATPSGEQSAAASARTSAPSAQHPATPSGEQSAAAPARTSAPSAQLPATPPGEQTVPASARTSAASAQPGAARPTTPGSEQTTSAPARTSAPGARLPATPSAEQTLSAPARTSAPSAQRPATPSGEQSASAPARTATASMQLAGTPARAAATSAPPASVRGAAPGAPPSTSSAPRIPPAASSTPTDADPSSPARARTGARDPGPLLTDTSPGGCATGECLPEDAPTRQGRDDPSRPLLDRWRSALDTVAAESARHAASLKQGRVVQLREGEVVLAFRPDAGFHRTTVMGQSGRQVAERLLSLHFGRPTRLVVDDRAAPGGDKSLAELDAEERAEHERATGQTVRNHPAIVATLKILGGELEHIQVLERERVGAPGSDVVDEQP